MDVLNSNQLAFVPDGVISDNIILSHELVKGNRRKGVSLVYMLKADMQKVYDLVEWPFFKTKSRLASIFLPFCTR